MKQPHRVVTAPAPRTVGGLARGFCAEVVVSAHADPSNPHKWVVQSVFRQRGKPDVVRACPCIAGRDLQRSFSHMIEKAKTWLAMR